MTTHRKPIADARGDLAVVALLAKAWQAARGCKRHFIAIYAMLLVALIVLQLILPLLLGTVLFSLGGFPLALLGQLLLASAAFPFLASLMTLGLRRAAGQPVTLADALTDGAPIGQVVLLGVLSTLLTTVGFALFVLPGIYLSVAFVFALPLLVDRGLPAVEAMKLSLRTTNRRWFSCFGLLLALSVVLGLGALTVIGLIWALPVCVIALAIAYRELFAATDAIDHA